MIFIYLLRNVQNEFSMTSELLVVTFLQCTVDFTIFYFLVVDPKAAISTSNGLQYIMVGRGLFLLYATAIRPLM